MRVVTVLGLAFVVAACGQGYEQRHMAPPTGPTSMMGPAHEAPGSRPNVVPVPAPVRNTRIHVANVSPAQLTVVQEPTRVEGGIAVAVEGTNIPLECTCPGGRRSFTLETLKLGFVIDVDSRSGGVIAQATIEGDANGDGENARIVLPPFKGDLQLVLREDEVWGLRITRRGPTGPGGTAWQMEISLVNAGSWHFTLDAFKCVTGEE